MKKLLKVLNATAITTCIAAAIVGCGSDQQPEPIIENDPENDPKAGETEQEDEKNLSAVYKKYINLIKGKIKKRYKTWEVNQTITIFQDFETHRNYFIDETNLNSIKITEIKQGISKYHKINNYQGFLFGDFSKNASYKSNLRQILLYDWRKPAGHQALAFNLYMSNQRLYKINQDFYLLVDYDKNSYLFNANAVSNYEYFFRLPYPYHEAGFKEYFPINDNYGYITFYRPFILPNGEQKLSAVIKFDSKTMAFTFDNWFPFALDYIKKMTDKILIGSLEKYLELPSQIQRGDPNNDVSTGGNTLKFIVYLEETNKEKQIEFLTKEVIDELKIKLITSKRLVSIHGVNDHLILINNKILTAKTGSYKTLLLDLQKPIGSRLINLNIDVCINEYQNITNHKVRIYNDDDKKYALLDLQQPIGKQVSNWTYSN